MAAAELDLSDIQGDVLRAYGNDYAYTTYLFVHIEDAQGGRTWLRDLLPRVTTAEPWPQAGKPETALNIAIAAPALEALGAGDTKQLGFSAEFCAGMAASAATLGDSGPSDPQGWEHGLHDRALHVLATVNARSEDALRAELARLRDGAAHAGGVTVAYEQPAKLLPGAREHFGYADGFAQPAVAGVDDDTDRRVGGGVLEHGGGWRALAPGALASKRSGGASGQVTNGAPVRQRPTTLAASFSWSPPS